MPGNILLPPSPDQHSPQKREIERFDPGWGDFEGSVKMYERDAGEWVRFVAWAEQRDRANKAEAALREAQASLRTPITGDLLLQERARANRAVAARDEWKQQAENCAHELGEIEADPHPAEAALREARAGIKKMAATPYQRPVVDDTHLQCELFHNTAVALLKSLDTSIEDREPEKQEQVGEQAGHRVEIEFDGFYPSITLIHPEGGCPLPDAPCESCGRDLRDTEAQRCHDCKAIEPGYCGLTDWVEAEGHELVRGKVTLPIRTEWTDCDHPLLHLAATASKPPAPCSDRAKGEDIGTRTDAEDACPVCRGSGEAEHREADRYPDAGPVTCWACGGSGKQQHGPSSSEEAVFFCDKCSWSGPTSEHSDCLYLAAPTQPVVLVPSGASEDWPEVTMCRRAGGGRRPVPVTKGGTYSNAHEFRRYIPAPQTTDQKGGE
jgi:hypothetical protein